MEILSYICIVKQLKHYIMNATDFLKAIEIISQHHSTKIVINHVEPNGQVDLEKKRIHIIDCCPSVINKLKNESFTVGMQNGMLWVDKI